jgi:hypothetical protein
METIISDLVDRFERGRLTRRQLIQGLSALAVAGHTATLDAQPGLRATGIDHVSVLVRDMQRSASIRRSSVYRRSARTSPTRFCDWA